MRSARVTIPPRPPDHLRRPRLVDKLHENIHRKLVLISAAAGYGKTSLLADFAHDVDQPVAWLRLVEADRDLVVLVDDLVHSLHVAFPEWQSLLPALAAQPGSQPLDLANAFIHEIEASFDDYFVVVLDDFHLVDDVPAVAAFFDALLANLPEQAHLVMAGRTLPALRFPRLVLQQQIAGLSEEHLLFTAEEAQALLRLRTQADVSLADAAALVADTEGWITGILLTSQLMWQGLPSRLVGARQRQPVLFSYLADEVLEGQPVWLRQFLLESAVLPEMEPPVCDAVLDRTDSAELLMQAEQRRLFVSAVGEDSPAYQYHHLFRDFLLARLRAQAPERLATLQARAAGWFAANGMPEAAVTYYVQAGCMTEAAQLCEAQAKLMFTSGRHATLVEWGEKLAPVAQQAPRLYLYLASIYIERRESQAAERALDMAVAGYTQRGDAVGLVEAALRRTFALLRDNAYDQALALAEATAAEAQSLGQTASHAAALRYAGRCLQALGQMPAAEQRFQAASELLQETEHRYDLGLLLIDLSQVLRLRGKTAQSARAQQQALVLLRGVSAVAPVADLLNNIAWDLHMLGQYEAALATYAEAWQWAHRSGSAYGEMLVLASQADLLADLGDRSQAAELYRQAMKLAEQTGDWAMLVYLNCALARQERWSENYVGALEWLRRAEIIQAGRRMQIPLANIDALRGMTFVEMGRLNEGRERLAQTCCELKLADRPIDLAQALLFHAYAEFRSHAVEAAAATLARALEVAEGVGYDQMLMTELHRTRPLLEACQALPETGPRVTALLAQADGVDDVRARLASRGLIAAEQARPAARAHGLEVQSLGPAHVLRDGVEISSRDWRSQRTRELFLYLVDRAPIGRDEILRTFWPDMPQSRAVANLYQTLYRLRRAVGDEVLLLEDQECRLAPGHKLRYDVASFETQASLALSYHPSELRRLGALATAVSLYTGNYCDDLSVEWATERRRALGELHLKVLCEYSDELLHLTRYEEARSILSQALAAEPLRDDIHARMLLCLAAMGRRHEMVSHYRHYREVLRAELGLDPPSEVRSLYARLIQ